MDEFSSISEAFDRNGVKQWELLAFSSDELAHRVCRSVNEISRFRDWYRTQIPPLEKRSVATVVERSVTTGVSSLDELLGGGLPAGSVTEISGTATAGKTCLCCQIATKNPESTIYITTEDKLSSIERRMADVSRNEAVLSPARFISVRTLSSLRVALATLKRHYANVDVVIIDSIGALWSNMKETDAQLEVEELQLRKIAHDLQAAIVVVNHVSDTKRPANTMDSYPFEYRKQAFYVEGDSNPLKQFQVRPKHAMTMADFVDTRLILMRASSSARVARVVFSKWALQGTAILEMSQLGLRSKNDIE